MIRANLEALALTGAEVRQERVERFAVAAPSVPAYDICFADPPYAADAHQLASLLGAVGERWLAPDAVVVVERASRDRTWTWPAGLSAVRSRRYGDTTLWYGRRS